MDGIGVVDASEALILWKSFSGRTFLIEPAPDHPKLPKVLEGGDMWEGRVRLDEATKEQIRRRQLYCSVDHSRSEKSIRRRIPHMEEGFRKKDSTYE